MLIAVLDAEIYLKSRQTRAGMLRVVADNVVAALGAGTSVRPMPGNRIRIDTAHTDPVPILTGVFGIGAIEEVQAVDAADFDTLVRSVVTIAGPQVAGRTFAVRPRRLGRHSWSSQDLAVAVGAGLVAAGGEVDLGEPEITVAVRVVDAAGHVSTTSHRGAGGLPAGSQGRGLVLFSGGVDSPVAAYLVARRGVALDHLHFSLGCGQADHAAGIAHLLADRHGAGTDPHWLVADLEPAVAHLTERVAPRDRQMALKAVMYRAAERIAATLTSIRVLVTGESLGQVSSQTLGNIVALDAVVSIPVLRPLIGLDKAEIEDRARQIGTHALSARSRELCDISAGAKVSVATNPGRLTAMADDLEDLVADTVVTVKATRLAEWLPGSAELSG